MRKEQIYKISYLLFLNLAITSILLLLLNVFNIIDIDIFLNKNILLGTLIASLTLSIFYKNKLNNFHNRNTRFIESIFETAPYFFLSVLIILAINQFLKLEFLTERSFVIVAVGIAFGFLTFYKNRDRVEKELEDEKQREEDEEKHRFHNFEYKFPRINKIWGLRSIVRWMYKEGWWYSGGLIAIVFIATITRLWTLNYIDGLDNFTIIAVKNMYENGVSFYKYSILTPYLMLGFSKLFGYNMFSLRLPSILYSLITLIIIYLISKKINKKIALISILFFATSPWSIIVSRFTRDYAFDCLLTSIAILCSINIIKNIKNLKKKILLNLILIICLTLISLLNRREQSLLSLIMPISTFFIILKEKLTIKNSKYLVYSLIIPLIIFLFYFVGYSHFNQGFRYNNSYIDYLFKPSTDIAWQWFHGNLLPEIFIISIFSVALFGYIKNRNIIIYLYTSFILGLLLFILKFVPPSTDIPSRYIYFLFPIYTMIISSGLFWLNKVFSNKKLKFILIASLFFILFNLGSFIYALDPLKVYEERGWTNLQIDNLGVGRFEIVEVSNFVKDNLEYDSETIFVFDKKFAEFIYLFDLKMDGERKIISNNCDVCSTAGYDISKNTYVESAFWNIHELNMLLSKESEGYFISRELCISDSEKNYFDNPQNNCLIRLLNQDFKLEDKSFKFLYDLNGYKIYAF